VGKTQLALEYAHRHRAAYQVVWWIRAEEPATLATDYAGLADSLGLVVQEDVTNVQEIIPLVRAWLEHHEDWLLIFDDVGDPAYLDEAWS
jgi:hypothetical protein